MFNIFGINPIKSYKQIVGLTIHNHRIGKKYKQVSNVDPALTYKNKYLHNRFNINISKPSALKKAIESLYNSLDIKTNQNTTYAIEFMITASPEFFKNKKEDFILEWANKQVDFMKKHFNDKLTMAVLHMDESTPHIHFLVTTEQRTEKKYKNQFGDFHKITNSLNSHFLDKKYIKYLLDSLEQHNIHYGLKRGVKGSETKHKRPAKYNEELFIENERLKIEIDKLNLNHNKLIEFSGKIINDYENILENLEDKSSKVLTNIEKIKSIKLKFNEIFYKPENKHKHKL